MLSKVTWAHLLAFQETLLWVDHVSWATHILYQPPCTLQTTSLCRMGALYNLGHTNQERNSPFWISLWRVVLVDFPEEKICPKLLFETRLRAWYFYGRMSRQETPNFLWERGVDNMFPAKCWVLNGILYKIVWANLGKSLLRLTIGCAGGALPRILLQSTALTSFLRDVFLGLLSLFLISGKIFADLLASAISQFRRQ